MASYKKNPLKILLVDDQPIVIMAHCSMLEEMGYTPDIAVTGEEAVTKSANGYDVIFMDVDLPGISGIEAVAKIRQEKNASKDAFIILLTAYWTEEIEKKSQRLDINLLKTKPISSVEMKALILQIVE